MRALQADMVAAHDRAGGLAWRDGAAMSRLPGGTSE